MDDSTTHLILWGAAAYVAYEIYQSYASNAGNAAPAVQSSATGQVSVAGGSSAGSTGAAAPSSSAGAGVMHMGNPGMISSSDLAWRTGSSSNGGSGSGFSPLNIQPQYGSLATPTTAGTPRPATTWSMPGADAPDPSSIRASSADVARDVANISATLHTATVAEGGPGTIDPNFAGWFSRCTNRLGEPIPGCK